MPAALLWLKRGFENEKAVILRKVKNKVLMLNHRYIKVLWAAK
ncbi:hypothetical protein [Bacillus inaquosorum]|nr:hypothetical protein [Bacillus inaquosorum]